MYTEIYNDIYKLVRQDMVTSDCNKNNKIYLYE